MTAILFVIYLITSLVILYREIKFPAWELVSFVYLFIATFIIGFSWWAGILVWALIASTVAIIHIPIIRAVIADFLFVRVKNSIPKLSKTEIEALNAGDTWFEQDIFRGTPDWEGLAKANTELTTKEQAFLNNETEILCAMLNDWNINQVGDLPENVWEFIKEKGFFGLVIPEAYGGKGFSARAHSEVIIKIASRCGVAAITVMVPNSLGPAELLNHYGTEEQKTNYLPKLATGKEIPCFALTEPGAGSDATSIRSEAIVKEKEIDGINTLVLEICLSKRWITLAPVATLIGLAVNLRDPFSLLKGEGSEGITCLLIPRATKNLDIGNRHIASGQSLMNGTIRGKNIIVPISSIIGGQKNAGQGWKMLVECLSIGRSISLPALSASSSAVAYITSTAFARIRRQFNMEIGQFEGVAEKLAEIAGLSYLINATRLLTLAAVNENKKPSVASAIAKYFNTELARKALNAAMDVHAGRTVVFGPRNYLANFYASAPMSITVEGANIMTRNLLIFGQGAIACHPFVRLEFEAISSNDSVAFRKLLWEHIYYFLRNFAKAVCTSFTGGYLISSKKTELKRKHQILTRLSYAYAFISDFALIYLGGKLKRKERLSARLADGMSYLYLAMAAIKYTENKPKSEDLNLHAAWACDYCFYHAQKAMISFCQNFPSRILGVLIRFFMFPLGQTMKDPNDKLDHQLAQVAMQNNDFRNQLKAMIFLGGDAKEPINRMERTLQLLILHNNLLPKAKNLNDFQTEVIQEKLAEKIKNGDLSAEEMQTIIEIEKARWDALQVDEFAFDAISEKHFDSLNDYLPNPFDFNLTQKAN